MYTTLLMSTGLTFGTISSLFGLSHGIINQAQYSALVAASAAPSFRHWLRMLSIFRGICCRGPKTKRGRSRRRSFPIRRSDRARGVSEWPSRKEKNHAPNQKA
jgi:hypothetical protein